MEPQAYASPDGDARQNTFLVARLWNRNEKEIGGCPWASTLTAYSKYFDSDILISLGCKRWGCTHCGPVRVAQMARNVARAKPNKFITLTTDSKLWENGRAAFDGIRRKLPNWTAKMRKYDPNFEYVRILELHKNGMPHWHLLARSKFIPQQYVSDEWAKLTGSPVADIRAAKNGMHAARYVMKYMCKCKYISWTDRRVSWSRKFFPKQPDEEKVDWGLKWKVHSMDPPAKVMGMEYTHQIATRCGAYAWLIEPDPETREEWAQRARSSLVPCIESCVD